MPQLASTPSQSTSPKKTEYETYGTVHLAVLTRRTDAKYTTLIVHFDPRMICLMASTVESRADVILGIYTSYKVVSVQRNDHPPCISLPHHCWLLNSDREITVNDLCQVNQSTFHPRMDKESKTPERRFYPEAKLEPVRLA